MRINLVVCHLWWYITFGGTSPHGLVFLPKRAWPTCVMDLIGTGVTKGSFEVEVMF